VIESVVHVSDDSIPDDLALVAGWPAQPRSEALAKVLWTMPIYHVGSTAIGIACLRGAQLGVYLTLFTFFQNDRRQLPVMSVPGAAVCRRETARQQNEKTS